MPQVRVGTVIEYEYRLESDYYYQLRDWYAQSNIPVLYTRYSVSIPEWLSFHIEESGMNTLEKQTDSNSLTVGEEHVNTEEHIFIGRNLPALKDDDYVWRAEDYGSKVTHELQGIYIPGYVHKNYSSTWKDIDERLEKDDEFGGRIKKSSPLKDDILAAWAKSGNKVLKEGTGTNADINFLLINMLHDAGIESSPVVLRLRNRGRLPLSHASMKYLSTFVVAVELNDSTTAYFDSSAQDGYLNVLPAVLSVDRARIIRKDHTSDWVNLQNMALATERSFIQATLTADGQLSGTLSRALDGEAAAAVRKRWRTAKDSADVIHDMQEDKSIEISDYRLQGRYDFSPRLRETIQFTKQCTTAGDIIYLNPLVIPPITKNPFTAKTRNLPIELPYKQRTTLNVTLTLPDGWQLEETPKPIILRLDGITASIMYQQKDNLLTVLYKENVSRTFFTQQQYQDMKALLDKQVESCKNIVTLTKKTPQ